MRKSTKVGALALGLILALSLGAKPQSEKPKPLSADDVTLLLIGGASQQKMLVLIHERGIDFALNPDLVKQFYQDGANDQVIDALQKAGEAFAQAQEAARATAKPQQNTAPAPPSPQTARAPSSPPSPAASPVPAGPLPNPQSTPGEMPAPASAIPSPTSTNAATPEPQLHVRAPAPKPAAPPASKPASEQMSDAPLPDPSPSQIQQIIQEFTAKEKLFEDARNNYTYHQVNKVEEFDASGNIDGTWEQDWDILFGANGQRIEQVTYAPENTLKQLILTEQDMESFRSLQPYTVTTDTLPEYDIQYMGHVHVDYITCYVFQVRPKEIKKGHLYFKGVVWVDDHDIQIVKAEGQTVPENKQRFPRFTTWRQQIDGKYWFPVFTDTGKQTLYFDGAPPVQMREIVKYTDYKQFKSRVKITPVAEKH